MPYVARNYIHDISPRIIEKNTNTITDYFDSSFSRAINQFLFLSVLYLANIVAVFKKGEKHEKEHLRPL